MDESTRVPELLAELFTWIGFSVAALTLFFRLIVRTVQGARTSRSAAADDISPEVESEASRVLLVVGLIFLGVGVLAVAVSVVLSFTTS